MTTNQTTDAAPATDAEKRRTLAGVIARQLDQIAPGTARVRTVPVTVELDGDQHRKTWVALDDALGHPIEADRAAHRAARGLLRRMLPAADWSRPLVYDAVTGELSDDESPMPEELL
ncbi:hypothetical protein [Streptomyces sp. NPDC007063]|uniref:hypothetical protein n=1 Tax=Streptomyces sp. NPDC007063 TaxID=3364772 RepID=UPI003674AE10